MPLPDSPAVEGSRTDNVTAWEEWLRQGSFLPDVEVCLLSILARESDPVTRRLIVSALGRLGSDHSIDSLVRTLRSDVPSVRMEAAASLGLLGSPRAVAPISEAVRDPDPNVRANACMALGRIGGREAAHLLQEALAEGDPFVRRAAEKALSILSEREPQERGTERPPPTEQAD